MNEIQMTWWWLRAFAAETAHRHGRNERGASALEVVIIGGGLAAMAIAAVAIIRGKVMGKANSIPTD